MIDIKNIYDIDQSSLRTKDLLRILSTRKSYVVMVDSKVHLTDDYNRLLMMKYPTEKLSKVRIYKTQ